MNNLFLDIETLPTNNPRIIEAIHDEIDWLCRDIKSPSNYKDPDKISAYITDKKKEIESQFDDLLHKTALDGGKGRVYCIGYAHEDDPVELVCHVDNEVETLKDFFSKVKNLIKSIGYTPLIIGHNVEFDLRFLTQRAIVHGIHFPSWWPHMPNIKPWEESIFDTMTAWAGSKRYVSLDNLCLSLGIEGKSDGFDGSKVWEAYQDGDHEKIQFYCMGDVERVRRVYKMIIASYTSQSVDMDEGDLAF